VLVTCGHQLPEPFAASDGFSNRDDRLNNVVMRTYRKLVWAGSRIETTEPGVGDVQHTSDRPNQITAGMGCKPGTGST
jgi:hypothetical protein